VQWLRRRDRLVTIALVLLALAARVAFAWLVPAGPAWDGVLYERGARSFARGLGYATYMFVHRSSDTVPTAFYPVGYPAFLGAAYALFGTSLTVMRLVGCVVSALTVGITHRLCLRFATRRASHLASLALALMPGQVIFAESAMTEPLFGLLLGAALFAFVHRSEGPRLVETSMTGVLLAAATYVRPQAVLLAPVFAFARRDAWRHPRATFRQAAIVCAVTVALVLPWSARNCARLDGCAFVSTNGGSNLAIGAVPRANGRYFPLDANDGCRGVVGEVARDRCWRGVALRAIAAAPRRWLQLAFVKLDHTMSYESFPIGYLREARAISVDDARARTLRRAITFPWRVLVVLALLALLPIGARRRLPDSARIAIAITMATLATHLLFFGGDRYHLPLVPFFVVIAAGALRDLPPVRRSRRRFTLARSREHRVFTSAADTPRSTSSDN
jgi:4-amino-4-deoxy-L-arabinose transferase-like glycosyltransferase